jgi:membrane protease YdiL (CAAX protease family)
MRKVALFLGLTFFVDWLLAALFVLLGGRWNTLAALPVGVGYMFVPMAMAIGVQKWVCQEPVREPLGISFRLNRWFLVAWLLPPVFAFATIGVSLSLPGVEYSSEMAGLFDRLSSFLTPEQLAEMKARAAAAPVHLIWLGLLQALAAGVTVNAVAAFGEEVGWRGFLQKELGPLGFWRSSATVGVIWGVWHAPLILQGHNYPQHPISGVGMMILWCVLLSPIFSYIRLKARSVIAAAIVHGSLNATVGLSLMVVKGGNDLLVGTTGLAGVIVLAMANAGIFLYDRRITRKPP